MFNCDGHIASHTKRDIFLLEEKTVSEMTVPHLYSCGNYFIFSVANWNNRVISNTGLEFFQFVSVYSLESRKVFFFYVYS